MNFVLIVKFGFPGKISIQHNPDFWEGFQLQVIHDAQTNSVRTNLWNNQVLQRRF